MRYDTSVVHISDLSEHLDTHAPDGWLLKTILPLPSYDMGAVYGGMGWQGKATTGTGHPFFLVIMEHDE